MSEEKGEAWARDPTRPGPDWAGVRVVREGGVGRTGVRRMVRSSRVTSRSFPRSEDPHTLLRSHPSHIPPVDPNPPSHCSMISVPSSFPPS